MSEKLNFTICSSVIGSSHLAKNTPCQDASKIVFTGKAFDTAILALSDGAGSAKHSDQGACLIVDMAINFFIDQLYDHPTPSDIITEFDDSDVRILLKNIRTTIKNTAKFTETDICDYSATLLCAVAHKDATFFLQIGDGCWTYQFKNELHAATWPYQGEFVGQTVFATCEDAANFIQTHIQVGKVDFIIGITDGLERLALDFIERQPSPKFYVPLISSILKLTEYEAHLEISKWLSSEAICQRTNDDKTLVSLVLDDPRF